MLDQNHAEPPFRQLWGVPLNVALRPPWVKGRFYAG